MNELHYKLYENEVLRPGYIMVVGRKGTMYLIVSEQKLNKMGAPYYDVLPVVREDRRNGTMRFVNTLIPEHIVVLNEGVRAMVGEEIRSFAEAVPAERALEYAQKARDYAANPKSAPAGKPAPGKAAAARRKTAPVRPFGKK